MFWLTATLYLGSKRFFPLDFPTPPPFPRPEVFFHFLFHPGCLKVKTPSAVLPRQFAFFSFYFFTLSPRPPRAFFVPDHFFVCFFGWSAALLLVGLCPPLFFLAWTLSNFAALISQHPSFCAIPPSQPYNNKRTHLFLTNQFSPRTTPC